MLTDEQNLVTGRYTYGLSGGLTQHEGLTQQPFAYNGRDGVMTDANGLYYMRARYYDPKLKRFLNRDVIRGEIQDGQTFNRYAYVNGNPVSYIDPLGLMKCETEGTGETSIPGQGYNNETYAPRPVKPQDATDKWDEFLGPGEHTNIHPRTGQPDPNRIVSEDGTRSIRYGDHEMNSSPTKHHYHEETWTYDPVNNV